MNFISLTVTPIRLKCHLELSHKHVNMDLLFMTTFPTPLEDQSYELPSHMQHGDIELQNIAQAISKN